MNNLAVITARGGSKRIPQKNIRTFIDKPIIAYSIEAAINSNLFDEIMVSTDSEEIAEVAIKYGAKVPFMRSAKNSDDFATTNDVLLEVFNKYKEMGFNPKIACCLYPTAPFITAKFLQDAFNLIKNNKNIYLTYPVVKFSFPPQRALYIDEVNKTLKPYDSKNINMRSQDLLPLYHDVGQFYMYRVEKFLNNPIAMKEHVYPIIINDRFVQDIDNLSDWDIAEIKYEILKKQNLL